MASPLSGPPSGRAPGGTPPRPAARGAGTSSTTAATSSWSPYHAWRGDEPAEPCEVFLYALLWLEAVALAPRKGLSGTRASICAQLVQIPSAWRRIEALHAQPIPMEALIRAAMGGGRQGAGAMEVLGPVLYAWLQYEQLLQDLPTREAAVCAASWHGISLTPRQLCLYLEAAALETGKKGAKLRFGGQTCRWREPTVTRRVQRLIFEMPDVRNTMLRLLALPLGEAQAAAFGKPSPFAREWHALSSPPRDSQLSSPAGSQLSSPPRDDARRVRVRSPPSSSTRVRSPPSSSAPLSSSPPSAAALRCGDSVAAAPSHYVLPASPAVRTLVFAPTAAGTAMLPPPLIPARAAPPAPRTAEERAVAARLLAARSDSRRLASALSKWQRLAKAHALHLTVQAFDRHLSATTPAHQRLVARALCVRYIRRWHYTSRLASLAEVRRARLKLAFEFHGHATQAQALNQWRSGVVTTGAKGAEHTSGRVGVGCASAGAPDSSFASAEPEAPWHEKLLAALLPKQVAADKAEKAAAAAEKAVASEAWVKGVSRRVTPLAQMADFAVGTPPRPNWLELNGYVAGEVLGPRLNELSPPRSPRPSLGLLESAHAVQDRAIVEAKANAERVAEEIESLVEQHGKKLARDGGDGSDGGDGDGDGDSSGQHVMDERRVEWFDMQTSLEKMQATQASALAQLTKAAAIQPLLSPSSSLLGTPVRRRRESSESVEEEEQPQPAPQSNAAAAPSASPMAKGGDAPKHGPTEGMPGVLQRSASAKRQQQQASSVISHVAL